jgi:hypothetical protein
MDAMHACGIYIIKINIQIEISNAMHTLTYKKYENFKLESHMHFGFHICT